MWLLLQAEFLAMILMLVYVGAVMVLFLFVVMMVDIDMATLKRIALQNLAAAVVGILIVAEMSVVIFRGFCHVGKQVPETASKIGLTAEIGKSLFTEYLFQVELAAMLLLVALVGAVVLTFRRRTDARYTSAGEAVKVKPSDRLRLVKMATETVAGNSMRNDDEREDRKP